MSVAKNGTNVTPTTVTYHLNATTPDLNAMRKLFTNAKNSLWKNPVEEYTRWLEVSATLNGDLRYWRDVLPCEQQSELYSPQR